MPLRFEIEARLLPVIEFQKISVLIQCFKLKSIRNGKGFFHTSLSNNSGLLGKTLPFLAPIKILMLEKKEWLLELIMIAEIRHRKCKEGFEEEV